ncbi:MAG: aryl-sulfate sulfotransferase, partial [Candidatus Kapaibacterium sp.]
MPADTTRFSHQHDPVRIANGHITLFDNGNLRLKDTTINAKDTIVNHPFTRALEYDLDEVNHKATVVWQFDNLPYCAAAGNVQRLDNGNSMIGLGIVVQ